MITNKQDLLESKIKQTILKIEIVPLILLIIALFSLSIAGILIKLSLDEMSINLILFNRSWIAAVIFGSWSAFSQLRTKLSGEESIPQQQHQIHNYALLLGASIAYILGRMLWTWSLTQTSIANANVLASLSPIFTTLGGWLLFKQLFDRKFLMGMLLAIVGALALGLQDLIISDKSLNGDFAALVCSMLYAIAYLILEYLRSRLSVVTVLTWRCLVGTLLTLPLVQLYEEHYFPTSLSSWLIVISLALVCEGLGHGLTIYSLKNFSSTFVLIVLLLDPVIAGIMAWIIFSEKLSFLNLLGFNVIIVGIYLAKTAEGASKKHDPDFSPID